MSRELRNVDRAVRTQQELNAILLAHERFLLRKPGGAVAQLGAMDLSGLNFSQRNLSDIDLAGATLRAAVLARTNLERAIFYCADLRLADLRHANLAAADLRGTSLRGANLSCAILDNADLRAATMTRSGVGADKERAPGASGGVDFSNCSMKRASFNGANLESVNFTGAMLQGAEFKGAKLANVTFRDAVLTGVNLADLKVGPDALEGAVTDPSAQRLARAEELKAMIDVHYDWIRTNGREGKPANFDGEDLRPLQSYLAGRHLTGLSARNAIAIGVNFAGCQLQGARFDGADLRDADFSDSDLRAASFRTARLSHARFAKADLRTLSLTGGRQQPVDLGDAMATTEQFAGALLDGGIKDLGLRTPEA